MSRIYASLLLFSSQNISLSFKFTLVMRSSSSNTRLGAGIQPHSSPKVPSRLRASFVPQPEPEDPATSPPRHHRGRRRRGITFSSSVALADLSNIGGSDDAMISPAVVASKPKPLIKKRQSKFKHPKPLYKNVVVKQAYAVHDEAMRRSSSLPDSQPSVETGTIKETMSLSATISSANRLQPNSDAVLYQSPKLALAPTSLQPSVQDYFLPTKSPRRPLPLPKLPPRPPRLRSPPFRVYEKSRPQIASPQLTVIQASSGGYDLRPDQTAHEQMGLEPVRIEGTAEYGTSGLPTCKEAADAQRLLESIREIEKLNKDSNEFVSIRFNPL